MSRKLQLLLGSVAFFVIIIAMAYFDAEKTSEQAMLFTVTPEPSPSVNFESLSLATMAVKDFNGRDLKLGKIQSENESYTRYTISYTSGELTISGIMNIPKGKGPFPVLFLNHGYIDPNIYTNGRGLRREQDYLARHGFAVLHSDYRNHAQSDKDPDAEANVRTGYVEDVINAVLAVKNSGLASLDTERIGMLGHSMGGGIAQAIMVVKPDLVDAFILYAPVSSNVADSFYRWTEEQEEVAQRIREKYGDPSQNPKLWESISPRSYFDRVQSPVLIFHGTSDSDVPISWSRDTKKLLEEKGKSVTLVEYPGQPHEFSSAHPDFMSQSAIFFKENLK